MAMAFQRVFFYDPEGIEHRHSFVYCMSAMCVCVWADICEVLWRWGSLWCLHTRAVCCRTHHTGRSCYSEWCFLTVTHTASYASLSQLWPHSLVLHYLYLSLSWIASPSCLLTLSLWASYYLSFFSLLPLALPCSTSSICFSLMPLRFPLFSPFPHCLSVPLCE